MRKSLILLFFCAVSGLPGQSIRVLSYNIRYDNPGDGDDAWPKRRDFLAAQIRFHAPDVFGIQEGLQHQVEFLAEALPEYAWVGVGRDDGRTAGEYSALFYRRNRFAAMESGTFWLSETPDVPSRGWDAALNRICTFALLRDSLSGRKIWVFNTHFDHVGQVARRESANLMLKKIKEKNPDNQPVVFMGDLNSEPGEPPVQALRAELTETHDQSEIPAFGPSGTFNAFHFHEPVTRRIDYIFAGGSGLRVLRFAVLSDSKDCHYPSDHLPVMAELAW